MSRNKYKGAICKDCGMDTVRGLQISEIAQAKVFEFCAHCDYHASINLLAGPMGENSMGYSWLQCSEIVEKG